MVKKEKDIAEKIGDATMIALVVIAITLIGALIGSGMTDIRLDQEVADDICQQLTGNSTTVAFNEDFGSAFGGKLVCVIPSFDSTQNIIVKTNGR